MDPMQQNLAQRATEENLREELPWEAPAWEQVKDLAGRGYQGVKEGLSSFRQGAQAGDTWEMDKAALSTLLGGLGTAFSPIEGLARRGSAAITQSDLLNQPHTKHAAAPLGALAYGAAGAATGAIGKLKKLAQAGKGAKPPSFSGRGAVADEETKALFDAWVKAGRPPSYNLTDTMAPGGFDPNTGRLLAPYPTRPVVESTIREVGQADPRLSVLARTGKPLDVSLASNVPEFYGAEAVYSPKGALLTKDRPGAFISRQRTPDYERRSLAHEAVGHHIANPEKEVVKQAHKTKEFDPLAQSGQQQGYTPELMAHELVPILTEVPYATRAPRLVQNARAQVLSSSPELREIVNKTIGKRVYERTKELKRQRTPGAEE